MSDYTAAEVEEAVRRQQEEEDFEWGYEDSLTLRGERVPFEWVARTGGMDEGSYASHVFRLGNQLFKKEGYYQSHYGYDWDGDLYEVEAFEKTVTDYRPV